MKDIGIDQDNGLLAEPLETGKSRYRMNRWLPLAPFAGVIGTLISSLIYPPLDRRSFSLLAFLLFLPSVFLVSYVQKKQKRGNDVTSFFPMTTWAALAPLCIAAAVFANGALDRFPIESHPVVITAKFVRHGRGNSYYLQVPSWRANRSSEGLQVTYKVYAQFQTNDPIVVEMHRGALGMPWLGVTQETLGLLPLQKSNAYLQAR